MNLSLKSYFKYPITLTGPAIVGAMLLPRIGLLLVGVAGARQPRRLDDGTCVDDPYWGFGSGGKGCARLYDRPDLCRKKSADKVLGYEACPYACGLCRGKTPGDSESWYASGKTKNSCKWIGKRPDARCGKKDADGVAAEYACAETCAGDDADDHTADSCLADFYDEIVDFYEDVC